MEFDIKKITGKILKDNEVVGTGFLISNDLFITARHNVYKNFLGKPKEKEVVINFNNIGEVIGNTLDLVAAYDNRVDIVSIKLIEPILDINLTRVIKLNNSSKDFEFKSYGYPKEYPEGFYLDGVVISDEKYETNIDYSLKVEEKYNLGSYKGLSGSPILINNFIVGVLVEQGTERKLSGISFNIIDKLLFDSHQNNIYLDEKKLKKIPKEFKNKFNSAFINAHLEAAQKIAGPRYSEDLNITNLTYEDLLLFSGRDDFFNTLKKKNIKLNNCLQKLEECTTEDLLSRPLSFCKESVEEVNQISKEIYKIVSKINSSIILKSISREHKFFSKLNNQLIKIVIKLNNIFDIELSIFGEKFGKGIFKDKEWHQFMASRYGQYPNANLNILKEVILFIEEFKSFLEKNPLILFFSNKLLLKGVGGIGKTHSLCDLVLANIKDNIPSFIFFSQHFENKIPENVILEKLNLKNSNFDDFLYVLNIIGEIKETNILICIDALDEIKNQTYWNRHLGSMIEKFDNYSNIKLIISCRNIFLEETLDDEIIDKFILLEHRGLKDINEKNLQYFFDYYGLRIPRNFKFYNEFFNPLFLKLYCDILKDQEEENRDFYGIDELFQNIIEKKNKIISKKYDEISLKDEVVLDCVEVISEEMFNQNINFIKWKGAKKNVASILNNYGIGFLSNQILCDLISENLLKEYSDNDNYTISFSFEKFFDYALASKVINKNEIESYLKNKNKNYSVMEILINKYKEKYNKEMLKEYNLMDSPLYKNLFISSLLWRKTYNINSETKEIFECCLFHPEDSKLVAKSLFILFELILKNDETLNSEYFHNLFKGQSMVQKDCFWGPWMMKSYKKYDIIDLLLDDGLFLKEKYIDLEIIKSKSIILVWFTSLNDIYIRAKASKGLTNLIKLYPKITFSLIEKFKEIDDDYIQERLWGAIYATLILNKDKKMIKRLIKYIYINFLETGQFPKNVVLRDTLRNIAELAETMNILEHDITIFRPPYSSEKIEKIHISYYDVPKEDRKLFWNCTESDFGIYTIPSKVEGYGFTKKEVGILIYKKIINNCYSEKIKSFDRYINYTYGSLRVRDESVERVSKKYQKIFLNRILGQIYDNYPYKPKYEYDDEKEVIPFEQGNEFRNIDLTSLPYEKLKYEFQGNILIYDFKKIEGFSPEEWFKKEDVDDKTFHLIESSYLKQDYLLLKGYFDVEKATSDLEEYPKKKLWSHVESYLIKTKELGIFKNWAQNQHFWGQWMPSGYTHFYEGWIGEYPWSASYRNILENKEIEEEQVFNHVDDRTPPVKLIPTVNDFNNEKDSDFCKSKIGSQFLFPGEIFFKDLDLNWNGENAYLLDLRPMFLISNAKDTSIYVNKNLLNKYLVENGFSLVWTVLGEKQFISGGYDGSFAGSAEFSQTFVLESNQICPNHYFYKVNNPI
ncbi:MAG: hypothetical protein WBG30_15395 [Psychrilyobacter sp.]|uniref:hypothetical protein n=1 Tax=Psychrilyobacter sp. TaxID=2586924 RepID=UPI003C7708CA